MANSRQSYELVDAGLEVLVAGLQVRILPYSQQDKFKHDRERFLQVAASHFETYHGVNSPACALGQWCLHTHRWLQTRARDTSLTPEIALCDLERMQVLADFLGMDDVKDDLQVFVAHTTGTAGDADFAVASGGYGSLAALLAAAGTAFRQRLAELAPPFDADAAPADEAWRLLADRDFMSRYLIDGSQDRVAQCLALARMALLLRDFLHLELAVSPQAAIADAQRLGYLGELLGLEGWPRPAVADSSLRPPVEDGAGEADIPAPAEGLVIDLSHVVGEGAREKADRQTRAAAPVAVRPRAGEGAWEEAAGQGPTDEPDLVPSPSPDALPRDEPRGSGVTRLVLTLCVAVGSVALLTLVVAQPAFGRPTDWWQSARSLWADGTAATAAVPAATEEPAPTPTRAAVTVADILQPTATFTPVPAPTVVQPSAGVDLVLYAWPHLQAETVGTIDEGTTVSPAQVVTGAEQRWLRLDNDRFVLAEGIQNEPTDLPAIDLADLGDRPPFATPSASPASTVPTVNRDAYVYLHLRPISGLTPEEIEKGNQADLRRRLDAKDGKAIADKYSPGTEIVPVRRVQGPEGGWLELETGRFVWADAVDNVPEDLPTVSVADLRDGTPVPETSDES